MTHIKLVDATAAQLYEDRLAVRAPEAGFLRSILSASPDCVKLVGLDGRLQYMNFNGQNLMEVDDFTVIQGRLWRDLWPADAHVAIETSLAEAREGNASRFEAACPTGKGSPRWWDVSVSPVLDETGKVCAILSSSRDITRQREREARLAQQEQLLRARTDRQERQISEQDRKIADQDLLMREIDHRVKNSLALIASLLRLQARTAGEAAAAELQVAANRVSTVGRVHESLHGAGDLKSVMLDAYLELLCTEIVAALGGEEVTLDLALESCSLDADRAVPLGLIVAEIVTNAMRHGLSDGRGRLCVNVRSDGEGVHVRIADDGPGLPENFDIGAGKGLGMRIVQLHATQLGCAVEHGTADPSGAVFTLRI